MAFPTQLYLLERPRCAQPQTSQSPEQALSSWVITPAAEGLGVMCQKHIYIYMQAGTIAQLVECLSSMHEALGFICRTV